MDTIKNITVKADWFTITEKTPKFTLKECIEMMNSLEEGEKLYNRINTEKNENTNQ